MPRFFGLFHALAVSAAVTLIGMSSSAKAITLNDAASFASVTLNGIQQTVDFGTTSASVSATLGGASGAIAANSQPIPNIAANISVNGTGQSVAQALLIYYFAAVGPSNVAVPVTITASSWVSIQPQQIGIPSSSLYFVDSGTQLLGYTCLSPAAPQNCSSNGGEQQSFSIAAPLVLQSNTQYHLQLNLYVAQTTASGYIDAIVAIDPTFTLANQFHLEFSPGVGNSTSAVPIPAALPLFATGLVGLGLLGWRRKRKAPAAIAAG